MKQETKNYPIEDFLKVYPNYDLTLLPSWIRENIQDVKVTGYKFKSLFLPDGRHFNLNNKLNDLSGAEWSQFINSVFVTAYPTKGKEGYAHEIRKIHPSPKPPQLMRDIISFFTKENEIVLDTFMGVGGTLLGASLCHRRAVGIELNQDYIDAYGLACDKLGLEKQKTICGDCIEVMKTESFKSLFEKKPCSLILIDPPYGDMMRREKTGGSGIINGREGTPFTDSIKDLGNMDKNSFLKSLKLSVELAAKFLKNQGYIVIFIKDTQPKNKELNMLHYDVAKDINSISNINYKGMKIWADQTAKLYPYGYPFSFVANQIHQYILVFRKG